MYLKVTVKASAKIDSVSLKNGRYVISTREPAEQGRANASAHALLAAYIGVPAKMIALVRGADKPSKLFLKREVL